ncbi:MAG: hypothetical protein ACHQQQ_15010 [Bacteroidota bacterium]
MSSTYTIALDGTDAIATESGWLRSKKWDLTFISLSAIWVPLPFVIFYSLNLLAPLISGLLRIVGISFTWDTDASRNFVNALIALFIGGPHMYATYSRTLLDKGFSRNHKILLGCSILIPIMVIYLGVYYFQILITIFFFWASIHILHQITYILNCYSTRSKFNASPASNFIDYVVVFSSLYPIAIYKFIHDKFFIGNTKILYPDVLKTDFIFYGSLAVFVAGAALFIWKTMIEIREGTAHYPKILLISLTSVIAFILPAFNNLDVAFQGFNTWHSFQYLGLTVYINQLRHNRGEIGTKFIDRIFTHGNSWQFYLFNVGLTVMAVFVISFLIYLKPVLGLSFDQCYYIVVLSFLLVHYLHDHLLFTDMGILSNA